MKIIYDSNGFIYRIVTKETKVCGNPNCTHPLTDGSSSCIEDGLLTYIIGGASIFYQVLSSNGLPFYKLVNGTITLITDYKDYKVDSALWLLFLNGSQFNMTYGISEAYSSLIGTVDSYEDLADLPSNPVNSQVMYVTDEDTLYEYYSYLSSWLIPLLKDGETITGCTLTYLTDSTLRVTNGLLAIRYHTYTNFQNVNLGWSNLETGSTKKANTWYFVYVLPNGQSNITGFISETAPTQSSVGLTIPSDSSYAKYHPTKTARFVGSFRTDNDQKIIPFRVHGIYTQFLSGYNIILDTGLATSRTAVNCREFVPVTSNSARFYYQSVGGVSPTGHIGDSTNYYAQFNGGSGSVDVPITNNSVYYKNSGLLSSMSIGVHGYYEII